jgi:large subunit ribosomal protein L30e
MALTEDIQAAVKAGKATIGYRRSLKSIKTGSPKLVVIANNLPSDMKKNIEQNAKIGDVKVEVFDGTSTQLGVICGKSFPISTLVIEP